MSATVSRSTRPADPEELRRLRSQASRAPLVGCLGLVFGLGAVSGFFVVNSWFGVVGGAVGAVAPLAIGIWVLVMSLRAAEPRRLRIAEDLEHGMIEVLSVEGATPQWVVAEHSSVDPAFVFELVGGATLVVLGQWLRDPATFGGTERDLPQSDEGERFANGLLPPFAFPTHSFQLHRFPVCGEVVRIRIDGDYVAPEEYPGHLDLRPLNDRPTSVLDCPASGLPRAVEAAQSVRPSRRGGIG
jgi:hypothetical protein